MGPDGKTRWKILEISWAIARPTLMHPKVLQGTSQTYIFMSLRAELFIE
ncbi:hypothetical protein Tco_1297223, partial [Tanacetum coccineum]